MIAGFACFCLKVLAQRSWPKKQVLSKGSTRSEDHELKLNWSTDQSIQLMIMIFAPSTAFTKV